MHVWRGSGDSDRISSPFAMTTVAPAAVATVVTSVTPASSVVSVTVMAGGVATVVTTTMSPSTVTTVSVAVAAGGVAAVVSTVAPFAVTSVATAFAPLELTLGLEHDLVLDFHIDLSSVSCNHGAASNDSALEHFDFNRHQKACLKYLIFNGWSLILRLVKTHEMISNEFHNFQLEG